MKRYIAGIILLVALLSAGWVESWIRPFGNSPGNEISGTGKDTVYIPKSLIRGASWLVFRVRADSVNDSLPNLTAVFGFKASVGGGAWSDVSFATADAGDTLMPLDNSVWDTLLTQSSYLPWFSTLCDSFRVIFGGKRASQAAKACSVQIYVKK